MNWRALGGILLIAGTSIGGGMLALPIANAATGFWLSSLILVLCWIVTVAGAFFVLEANLYLPRGKHMISMAAATLGPAGLFVAWLSYLILLYTLLSAYISGGADVFSHLLQLLHLSPKDWQAALCFTLFFGLVAYSGIKKVDLTNRLLMFGKLGSYAILVLLIAPKIDASQFSTGNPGMITSTLMILITSFGFAIIVPNLRDYFDDNIPLLKKVIWIGSAIPLVCYLIWDAVILGTLPLQGKNGLIALMQSNHATSDLARILSETIESGLISSFFNGFTSICMLTAFLSVSLCLLSFFADGLKWDQKGWSGLGLFSLTFIPPLILVIFYPGAYLHALSYAGMICVILLLLLPTLMTIRGRKSLAKRYTVAGGRLMQWGIVVISLFLLFISLDGFGNTTAKGNCVSETVY